MSPHLGQVSSLPGETLGVVPQHVECLAPWQWDLIPADIPPLPDNSTWSTDPQNAAETQTARSVDNHRLEAALTVSPQPATQCLPENSLSPSVLSPNQENTPPWTMPPYLSKAGPWSPPRHKTRERRPFTEAEDQALKRGYEKYGSQWCLIAKDPAFKNQRTSTDVRDRFRNAFPEEYARAGYKPRARALKRAVDKPKAPFVTHHMRPTRSGLSARRHKARRIKAEPMSVTASGPLLIDAKKPTDASEPTPSSKGARDVTGVSSVLLSNKLSQGASQTAGRLPVSPTSPSGSLPALTLSPLSLPEQRIHTAASLPMPTVKPSQEGVAPHSTSYTWPQPEASTLPILPARTDSVPFDALLLEPCTPLELPSSIATANAFPYIDEGLAQVQSATSSSMEYESAQTTNGPSTPGASPLSMPLSIWPTFPYSSFSVCDLPTSTALDMAYSLSAIDSASHLPAASNMPPSLALRPFRP